LYCASCAVKFKLTPSQRWLLSSAVAFAALCQMSVMKNRHNYIIELCRALNHTMLHV